MITAVVIISIITLAFDSFALTVGIAVISPVRRIIDTIKG